MLAAAALAAAGCGGDDEDSGGDSGATTTEQAPPSTGTGGGETETESGGASASAGKEKFASTCGGCHTLQDAGTNGGVGPNLDALKPDRERVLAAIESGPGVMPENLFQGNDAKAVAEYVASVAGS